MFRDKTVVFSAALCVAFRAPGRIRTNGAHSFAHLDRDIRACLGDVMAPRVSCANGSRDRWIKRRPTAARKRAASESIAVVGAPVNGKAVGCVRERGAFS